MNGVRFGKATYEKIETPMNKQKKEFEEYYNFFVNSLINIGYYLGTLKHFKKEYRKHNFEKYASDLVEMIKYTFLAKSTMDLANLYGDDKLGFLHFLNYIESNWKKIFTTEFITHIDYGDKIETTKKIHNQEEIFLAIKYCRKSIESNLDIINKLKLYRDKVIAHNDKQNVEMLEKNSFNLDDLLKIYSLTEEIFNKIAVLYDGKAVRFDMENITGLENIDSICNKYVKIKEQEKCR